MCQCRPQPYRVLLTRLRSDEGEVSTGPDPGFFCPRSPISFRIRPIYLSFRSRTYLLKLRHSRVVLEKDITRPSVVGRVSASEGIRRSLRKRADASRDLILVAITRSLCFNLLFVTDRCLPELRRCSSFTVTNGSVLLFVFFSTVLACYRLPVESPNT